MSEKVDRRKLAEYIFDSLDNEKTGSLKLSELESSLPRINKSNQKVVQKYISWFKSEKEGDFISRSDFIPAFPAASSAWAPRHQGCLSRRTAD